MGERGAQPSAGGRRAHRHRVSRLQVNFRPPSRRPAGLRSTICRRGRELSSTFEKKERAGTRVPGPTARVEAKIPEAEIECSKVLLTFTAPSAR